VPIHVVIKELLVMSIVTPSADTASADEDPIARQRDSRMPVHRYRPYTEPYSVSLPDRAWFPSRRSTAHQRGAAVMRADGHWRSGRETEYGSVYGR
jgi:PIN domain nuclease of toxin-antitoxin system